MNLFEALFFLAHVAVFVIVTVSVASANGWVVGSVAGTVTVAIVVLAEEVLSRWKHRPPPEP